MENPREVVQLHGGDTEIGEYAVRAPKAAAARTCGSPAKLLRWTVQGVRPKAQGPQASLGPGQFDGVDVKTEESSAGLEAGEEFAGMTAIAEGAINRHLARLRGKDLQDFGDQDGSVSAGGGFARSKNLGHSLGITLRVVLLVFLLEPARVSAPVTGSAPVRVGRRIRFGRRGGSVRRVTVRCISSQCSARRNAGGVRQPRRRLDNG